MYRTPCPIKGVLRIQQYLQIKHYALWEVIEFGDSYEAPQQESTTASTSEGSAKKKRRTVAFTTNDMQKRRNDVMARTTLLLALPDEHQLRFSKYKTAQELWAAILKTFGGNEATKKTKKNLLNHLEFMDIEIEQDDLNQKFLTSLAPEWLMHTIVWRNRSDLDTMSLDDLYNHLKVYEPKVQKKSKLNSQNMAFISSAKNSSGNEEVNTASIPTVRTDVAGFDKSKVECFNCHKMGHFARECKAPKSQDRGRRYNYRQGSKVEEQAPKALMAIDKVGCDWSFMENEEENHALVVDEEAPTEFALMAKSSSDNEVFDNSLCSKAYKKNNDSLNSKIAELSDKLSDTKTNLYHYKLGLAQVEARLVEPSPAIESNSDDFQNINPSVAETEASSSTILSKPAIKFVKSADRPTETKTDKVETAKKPAVKYAKMYRKTSKSPNVRGNQRNWNNLKSHQLGKNFEMKNKACFNCGDFNHLSYGCSKWVKKGKPRTKYNTHKSISPRTVFHKADRSSLRTNIPNMNAAQPDRTSFYKPAHSYFKRPFQRTSAVRSQFSGPRVSTVNRKFPTVNRKLPTSNSKFSTADLGIKGKAIKASACWIWKPRQNLSVSLTGLVKLASFT
nr:ribonuclease H-like domain-containing protein [Tanacetum cinerariifolium]